MTPMGFEDLGVFVRGVRQYIPLTTNPCFSNTLRLVWPCPNFSPNFFFPENCSLVACQ